VISVTFLDFRLIRSHVVTTSASIADRRQPRFIIAIRYKGTFPFSSFPSVDRRLMAPRIGHFFTLSLSLSLYINRARCAPPLVPHPRVSLRVRPLDGMLDAPRFL